MQDPNLTPEVARRGRAELLKAKADALRPSLATMELPVSHHQRLCVVKLGLNPELAFAAAIGLCWRGPGRPSARWTAADPAAYAEAVFDELVGRAGVTYGEIVEVGAALFGRIVDTLPTAAEVKEAQGNSDTEEGPSA